MDDSSRCGTSNSEVNSAEARRGLGDELSVDKISDGLSSKMNINGGSMMKNTNGTHKSRIEGYYTEELEDEEEEEEDEDLSVDAYLAQMGYGESAPKREKNKEPQMKQHYDDNDGDEEEEEEEEEEDDLSEEAFLAQMGYLKNEPPKHEPITTPTAALNLVSAFKGSRNKEGKLSEQRRVSWAPDVYDPPPTSDEHYAASKTERHKSEPSKVKGLAGKNRQKCGGKASGAIELGIGGGKGSKGGGGSKGNVGGGQAAGKEKEKKHPDKKQVKKHGGSAGKYASFDDY